MMRLKSLYILHILVIIAASVSLFVSCARMGTPDGGLYDETPPKIVKTTPKNGMTNASTKKVVLEFDEIVKLDNSSSVVVSPPQMEMPEVEASGRKVTVQLMDTIRPNMTYTIDFGNSISDNNEGNPFGDYAFTFSTGAEIDTFQCSGYVLDASNLEPIKDMLVGLYTVSGNSKSGTSGASGLSGTTGESGASIAAFDSTFYKTPFERISHTDSRGHFVIKGLKKDAMYRIFALKDQDQDYKFSQKSEMLGFSSRTFTPSCKPDIRPDTVWHDSIHFDSIVYKPYTHFYPDDISLLAFTEGGQDRHMLKKEREELNRFSFYFTAPDDTLPKIKGLNFAADNAFVVDASEHKDSITYWIRDSLIYNLDTLSMELSYHDTDTLGNLVMNLDTLDLVSKISKEKFLKLQQTKYDDWLKDYKKEHKDEIKARKKELKEQGIKDFDEDTLITIPPMPEEFMEVKFSNTSSLDPDKNIDITFSEPIDSILYDKIHFGIKVDSITQPLDYLIEKVPNKLLTYRFYGEWLPDSTFVLEADTGAFVSIYGKRNEACKRVIKVKSLEEYGTLYVTSSADTCAIVQLMDSHDTPVKSLKIKDGKADFYFISPGAYYLRMFYDRNGNGEWDTGDYGASRQAEEVYYNPKEILIKANWEFAETWNPTALPIFKQKAAQITKQKPDKEKTIKSRNAEKLAEMAKRKKK